jgi:hypothetical protein
MMGDQLESNFDVSGESDQGMKTVIRKERNSESESV